jgi:hypothetical protein
MDFAPLPIVGDQGLPQVFNCDIGDASFDFGVYANLAVAEDDPPGTRYDLASPDAPGYLVLRVVHQHETGPRVVLLRRLVAEPDLVHEAGPLAVRMTRARIARGNLNGTGNFGTQITIEVARRWA